MFFFYTSHGAHDKFDIHNLLFDLSYIFHSILCRFAQFVFYASGNWCDPSKKTTIGHKYNKPNAKRQLLILKWFNKLLMDRNVAKWLFAIIKWHDI